MSPEEQAYLEVCKVDLQWRVGDHLSVLGVHLVCPSCRRTNFAHESTCPVGQALESWLNMYRPGHAPVVEEKMIEAAVDDGPSTDVPEHTPWAPERSFVSSRRNNDCPVVAAANIFCMEYDEAKLRCFHNGWSSLHGIQRGFLELMAEELGYEVTYRADLSHGCPEEKRLPEGSFFVYVQGHVMPGFDGKCWNLAGSGHKNIQEVYEVFKDTE